MSIAYSQIQSSDISRNPLKVFTAAEAGPVLLTRRDGQNFMIMTESEALARETLVTLAGKFFAVGIDKAPGTDIEKMIRQFPWIAALDETNQAKCVAELTKAGIAAFATGEAFMFEVAYNSWLDSAAAMAAGLHLKNRDWTEEPIKADRP